MKLKVKIGKNPQFKQQQDPRVFLGALLAWLGAAYDISLHGNHTLPRQFWKPYDPTLIGEAFYAFAFILAFGKIMYFLQISRTLGPLQVLCLFIAIFTGFFPHFVFISLECVLVPVVFFIVCYFMLYMDNSYSHKDKHILI